MYYSKRFIMPKKKKKKVMSLEVLEVNSLWDYRRCKTLRNFICNEEDAENTVQEMVLNETWKQQGDYQKQVKAILAPSGTRNASTYFYGDDISYEEVKLPVSVKPGTKYVYKVYDCCNDKLSTEYGTQKDIVAYISKKIKTKYAYIMYNGKGERIEYSPKAVTDVLNGLEKTTSQCSIEPFGRSGATEDLFIVSIFENHIK